MPKNYKYDYLKGLGNVEKLLLDDGITRFTIGGAFKTLNEAINHKNKVQSAGQKDAFVTAIYNGKRVYLEDLEKIGLIPVQPK
jgi:ATP-dependent protease Clp ATPase subunit